MLPDQKKMKAAGALRENLCIKYTNCMKKEK
jgi:hypothetical protein